MIKRVLAGAASVALAVGLALATTSTASASGKPLGAGPEDVTFTKLVKDAGGQDFRITGTWGHTYKDNAGNFRVTLYGVKIDAVKVTPGPLPADPPVVTAENLDDEGLDGRVRVYSGYADGHTNLIQDKKYDGADDPITLNPKNPLNRPEVTKIVFTDVGVDGDGKAGAPRLTVEQPVIGDGVTP